MSFLDIIIENKKGTYLTIRGNAGMFSGSFKKDKNIRVLKVYQVIGRGGVKGVKSFKYDNKKSRIFIETHLSYFGEVKFLIKWCEI